MAVKPTIIFTWASDATFGSGPATGNPTKVNPPGWPAVVQGNIPDLTVVAEFQNTPMNALGLWTGWLFAGSFAGAADPHIVETDANGDATVQDIVVIGSLRYSPVRVVTRVQSFAAALFGASFQFIAGGGEYRVDTTAPGTNFFFPLRNLPNGAVLDSVTLKMNGGAGHTPVTMTATPPLLRVRRRPIFGNASIDIATQADTTDTTTYEADHDLTVAAIGHTIDTVANSYTVLLDNEVGGDAQSGLNIFECVVVCTIAADDEFPSGG